MKRRPEWTEVEKNVSQHFSDPAYLTFQCSCKQHIDNIQAASYHYNLGHFDIDEAFELTDEHKHHLHILQSEFLQLFTEKYTAGVREHSGGLWNLDALDLIDNAIKENLDQFAYLMTLRDKIVKMKQAIKDCREGRCNDR